MQHKKHIRLNLQNQRGDPDQTPPILSAAHDLLRRFATPGACVGAYWPLPDDVDCRSLLEQLHASGFPIALPVVIDQDRPMLFRTWTPGDSLTQGYKTSLQPHGDKPVLQPNILLVPLFGFRRDGYRLGRGGGFYDRTLAHWRAQAVPVVTIGLGWACREVSDLMVEPHDEKLDWIVTEQAAWSTKE